MNYKLLVILSLILCLFITGCEMVQNMNNISQVTYASDSGSLLPELQWHEQITITPNKLTLTRNGKVPNTKVNAGTWEIALDAQKVTALFAQLQPIDCTTIKRIEPRDAPDGGGTQSYTIVYAGSKQCALLFDPGTTYTNGTWVVTPVDAFIRSLTLPLAAANRYQSAQP